MSDSENKKKDVCEFRFKKSSFRSGRQTAKKAPPPSSSGSSSADDDESAVVVNTNRKKVTNPMVQSTSTFRRVKSRRHHLNDSSESENDDKKWKADVKFESSRRAEPEGPRDGGATLTLETETEKDKDAQSAFERSQQLRKELEEAATGEEEAGGSTNTAAVYRGLANYNQYKPTKDTVAGNASSGFNRKGPMRAPDNIRSTVRWDYQPDICKDYKETGFCGFGDSCKFLHDRSDYKAGWQLELDHNRRAEDGGDDEDDNKYLISDAEELPFRCFICRESFREPVVTKCGHYFCQACALENYKKSSRCYVCGVQTYGVFNVAKELIKKLKAEEVKSAAKEQKADGDTDDESDD